MLWLTLLYVLSSIILIGPAVLVINRFGKKQAFTFGVLAKIIAFMLALSAMTAGNVLVALLLLLASQLLLASTNSFCNIATPSILADIADYGALRSKSDHGAVYYSMDNFLAKVGTISLGPALGIGIVAWFGFDPSAPVRSQQIDFAFILAMGLIPVALSSVSIVLFWLIPIDERRRLVISKALARQASRRKNGILRK